MSKKVKNVANAVSNEVAAETVSTVAAIVKEETLPSVASLTDGREYQLLYRPRMASMKRAPAGKIVVDGQEVDFRVTSNKGTAPADAVYTYVFFPVAGSFGFVTLLPGESLEGQEIVTRFAGDKPVVRPAKISTEKAREGYASRAALRKAAAATESAAVDSEAGEVAAE
jgi:hypothetical protein